MSKCKSIGCTNELPSNYQFNFCPDCIANLGIHIDSNIEANSSMAKKYPKYYKPVGDISEVDVYAVHQLFEIQDSSGCIHHASKKLLLSGVRTGGKSKYDDIREARDTLTRWLELNQITKENT